MADAVTFTIADYVDGADSVDVVYTDGTLNFPRSVNIVRDSDGKYDAAATEIQVSQVGRGVAVKIQRGVITAETIARSNPSATGDAAANIPADTTGSSAAPAPTSSSSSSSDATPAPTTDSSSSSSSSGDSSSSTPTSTGSGS